MRLGVHARAAHLEAERKRRARLRSVRPSLAIRSNARKPHYHALRLIEASKSSHRRSKAVHREAWNSRTGAQPEKQAVRRPVDRSRTSRRGGGSTASTAAAKVGRKKRAGFAEFDRIVSWRRERVNTHSRTAYVTGPQSCRQRALHAQDENRPTNNGKTGTRHALRSIHIKAGRTAWDPTAQNQEKVVDPPRQKGEKAGATTAASRVRKVTNSRTAIAWAPGQHRLCRKGKAACKFSSCK